MKIFLQFVVPIFLGMSAAHARDCTPGETSFSLISTQSGFAWKGIRLSISSYVHPRAEARKGAAFGNEGFNNLARVSLFLSPAAPSDQDTPSLVRDGIMRLTSNVWTFARKFPVTFGGIDLADVSFCSCHQVNLHCGNIIEYPTEGAVSMNCSLVIFDPAQIVTP